MATKKKKTGIKKPKSKKTKLTRWWAWFLVLLFVSIGALLLYQHYLLSRPSPTQNIELPGQKPQKTARQKASTTARLRQIKEIERPASPRREGTKEVAYRHYRTLYSTTERIPVWVAYELTDKEARGGLKRKNNFRPDPQLKEWSAQNADYTRSGYDRGHLAPSADMAFSTSAMDECFFFTNIAPQNPALNRGSWKQLEEGVRRWAQQEQTLYITTGTVTGKDPATIGKQRVAVPEYFYKAVLSLSHNRPKAIGFLFRNQSATNSPLSHAVTIDSLEHLTGMDLYAALPDSIEAQIESCFDLGQWPLTRQ